LGLLKEGRVAINRRDPVEILLELLKRISQLHYSNHHAHVLKQFRVADLFRKPLVMSVLSVTRLVSRVHQTLGTTPAVAAGVADHDRTITDMLALLDTPSSN
jgi:hypothetical protein